MNDFKKFISDYHAHLQPGLVLTDIDRNNATERELLSEYAARWNKPQAAEQSPDSSGFLSLDGTGGDENQINEMRVILVIRQLYPSDTYGWVAGTFYDLEDTPGR